ncbi:MAG: VCBS repeat-containing protein [Planctomycetota bacterium]|nr:VCBS repeat-containing protein [Planctomycetota bacterium]
MHRCLHLFFVLLVVDRAPAEDISTPLTHRLDRLEELTERFANELHGLTHAAQMGDKTTVVSLLHREGILATPFPNATAARERVVKWVVRYGWVLSRETRRASPGEFAADLLAYLARHKEVEDFRLKVVEATYRAPENALDAKLKVMLVGRNGRGERVWTRGTARATAKNANKAPRLASFRLETLETLVAERDIFTEVAKAAGVAMTDPDVLAHPTLGLAAYGVAAADVNRDGFLDVFSTGDRGNVLYLNRGAGTFRAIPVPTRTKATGPLFLDFDNDGDADLFLSANGKQMLLENRLVPDGKWAFRDVSTRAGIDRKTIGFSAAAGDVNGDGYPDIYVTAYNNFGPVLPDSWDAATNGLPNLLFVSKGDGTYEEAAERWGVAGHDWSYAAQLVDVDEDGRLDLYVANDFGSGNRLYLNRGDRFVDDAQRRNVWDGGYGMGVSFGDYDNDGDLDLHVTKMASNAGNRILGRFSRTDLRARERLEALASGNSLYRNNGRGVFEDISARAGPFPAGWAWGGGFIDFDNDGWEDIHTPNGHMSGLSMKDT